MTGEGTPANAGPVAGQIAGAFGAPADKYLELLNRAATGIYEIDFRTRRLVAVNDYICTMLGYTRDELLATDPLQLMDADSRARFQERILQWLGGQKPDPNVEYHITGKDGQEFSALLDITFTTDEQGHPAGAMVIAHDITERKRLEEELRSERELLQAIYDSIPVMLAIYDPSVSEIRTSEHVARVTGWTRQDLAESSIIELAYPDPDYRASLVEYMQSLQPGFRDLLMVSKDGTLVETSWANVGLQDGRQVGIGLDVRGQR
jgi:PAS domain S-box-containing protein